MKQLTMRFSVFELEDLARAWGEELKRAKRNPTDPGLRRDLDLLLRLEGAAYVVGRSWGTQLYHLSWAVPVLRKALAEVGATQQLRERVKALEAEVKELTKPKPKPKPKPRKPAPVKPPGLAAPVIAAVEGAHVRNQVADAGR